MFLNINLRDFPCKFYHTGAECYAKNGCRFSHEPLSEEMQNILADYLKMSHGDDARSKTIEDRDENRGSYERDQS
ncbi:hypothetical protein CEXT_748261 [Caerostris extrusa]|uniref:C3H1-type domain-containing protein n=1 Tax=Caerostris extrusa TaxID=172846 RepID=A0AAV4X8N5_CAEEX|nr:hypothetical protein CEXT_748261 [Caerostris extrusa]